MHEDEEFLGAISWIKTDIQNYYNEESQQKQFIWTFYLLKIEWLDRLDIIDWRLDPAHVNHWSVVEAAEEFIEAGLETFEIIFALQSWFISSENIWDTWVTCSAGS